MDNTTPHFETLKQILRLARQPSQLDGHPWTQSLIVQDALESCPELAQASPGQQLIGALAHLFPQLQPASPPRAGKRLDPRWGEFGLLAALYFTPFNHGTPFPTSLLDAWARIDCAILHSVYGQAEDGLSEEQVNKYRLVGDDVDYGSASTLSDWHKKGLQRFTEIALNRERFLARAYAKPSAILDETSAAGVAHEALKPSAQETKRSMLRKRVIWSSLGLLLLSALVLGFLKAHSIYTRGLLVYEDVTCLQQVVQTQTDLSSLEARCSALVPKHRSSNAVPGPLQTYERVLPVLDVLQSDLAAFKDEAGLLLALSPKLEWIPVYGKDIASAPSLIELAEHLVNTSLLSAQAADPFLRELQSAESQLDPAAITALLVKAGPAIDEARLELDRALDLREAVHAEQLSPRLRSLLVDELDPKLRLADQGLSLAQALPGVLGAGSDGPKTYLVLVENEDELRPTGGFITAVGNLVVHNGSVLQLGFEDSGAQEDWSEPYPPAPWQLQEYMNSPVLILRDANWFSDFPTAALWAEYLYAYTHDHSVDGVIAFDQQFLIMLLEQLGPLDVEGVSYPIDAGNVTEYMRQAKQPPSGESIPLDWTRKAFMGKLAEAILTQLSDGGQDWAGLTEVLSRALAERHLLLQFDDPALTALLAEHSWDNALRPAGGDYLMVTDSNIGFNKTNAVVDVDLTYDVDLSDLSSPQATLTLLHRNNAAPDVPCIHWDDANEITGEESYPIDRCYWNYLRVYKQAGAALLDASPHTIPAEWMILEEPVPARVDVLEEEIPGVQGFGTLLVVPGGEAWDTNFQFSLPASVLSADPATGEYAYQLRVQKQPGTLAHGLTVRIHLPGRAVLKSMPPGAVLRDNHLLLETDLRTDVEINVSFSVP